MEQGENKSVNVTFSRKSRIFGALPSIAGTGKVLLSLPI
jgi:hypothetical protein